MMITRNEETLEKTIETLPQAFRRFDILIGQGKDCPNSWCFQSCTLSDIVSDAEQPITRSKGQGVDQ